MFFKDIASGYLRRFGYPSLPVCQIEDLEWRSWVKDGKVVIKPQAGGSSIGVSVVNTVEAGMTAAKKLLPEAVVVEPYCNGVEFTVLVIESSSGPCALVPTEICIDDAGGIYDYRRKYLPTANTQWHCPPRLSTAIIGQIRKDAQTLFRLFGMNDFVRMDGWIVNNKVIFSDFNPISGMEQNSFMFLQASRVGMTHQEILTHIISNACNRYGIIFPQYTRQVQKKQNIPILMGGVSEERQVSLMSGTNVWLKLRQSRYYEPILYFLDPQHQVWQVPYTFALNHTVEEIYDNLLRSEETAKLLKPYLISIRSTFGLECKQVEKICPIVQPMSLEAFAKRHYGCYVFLALHGGFGEDGRMQSLLSRYHIRYNGSCEKVSRLGMDKYEFSKSVNALRLSQIYSLEKVLITSKTSWEDIAHLGNQIIVKPRDQGCSVGVFVLEHKQEFLSFMRSTKPDNDYIAERYIRTDNLFVAGKNIHHEPYEYWLELTIVVYEEEQSYTALYPSITVAKDAVLSMEEKFQGGTGINITPPAILSTEAITKIQAHMTNLAQQLGIKHYTRVDFFYNTESQDIIIIEMNSLPALTPSTVLFHQMLASQYAESPAQGLERLIRSSID